MVEEKIVCTRCGEMMKKSARCCLKCGNLNYELDANSSMKKIMEDSSGYLNTDAVAGENPKSQKLAIVVVFILLILAAAMGVLYFHFK